LNNRNPTASQPWLTHTFLTFVLRPPPSFRNKSGHRRNRKPIPPNTLFDRTNGYLSSFLGTGACFSKVEVKTPGAHEGAWSSAHAQALTRFLYGYYVRRFRVRTSPEVPFSKAIGHLAVLLRYLETTIVAQGELLFISS
jgi:hypothetical protein